MASIHEHSKKTTQTTLVDLGGMPGAHPPKGPDSFIFTYIFEM